MTSSNGGKGVSAGYLLLPGGASRGKTGLHSIELSAKGVPLLRTTPTQLSEHGSPASAYMVPSVSLVWEGTLQSTIKGT